EILVDKDLGARGGETALQLAFYPALDNTIVLYLNYFDNNLPWESRSYDYAMAAADFSLDSATGAITLTTALEQGDFVYAEYRHDGGDLFESVRDLVLEQSRVELYSMFANWNGAGETLTDL